MSDGLSFEVFFIVVVVWYLNIRLAQLEHSNNLFGCLGLLSLLHGPKVPTQKRHINRLHGGHRELRVLIMNKIEAIGVSVHETIEYVHILSRQSFSMSNLMLSLFCVICCFMFISILENLSC